MGARNSRSRDQKRIVTEEELTNLQTKASKIQERMDFLRKQHGNGLREMGAFRYAARDIEGVTGKLGDSAREWRIRDDVRGVWKRLRGVRGLVCLFFLLNSFLCVFFYKNRYN